MFCPFAVSCIDSHLRLCLFGYLPLLINKANMEIRFIASAKRLDTYVPLGALLGRTLPFSLMVATPQFRSSDDKCATEWQGRHHCSLSFCGGQCQFVKCARLIASLVPFSPVPALCMQLVQPQPLYPLRRHAAHSPLALAPNKAAHLSLWPLCSSGTSGIIGVRVSVTCIPVPVGSACR